MPVRLLALAAALLVALLAALLGACAAHPHIRYDPSYQVRELRAEDGTRGRLVLLWRGLDYRADVPLLRFRARVENRGPRALDPAPASFELVDGRGVSIGTVPGEPAPAVVEPGGEQAIEVVFPIPAGKRLHDFDVQDVTLRVRLTGGRWDWSVPFPHDYLSYDPPRD